LNRKIDIVYETLKVLIDEEYFFKINRELTAVFYWSLSILQQEAIPLDIVERHREVVIEEIKRGDNYQKFLYIKDMNYESKLRGLNYF